MTRNPIAYIVFNRPKHTEKTFAIIREQRPSTLFIIADGPRVGHATDPERCAAVRRIVDQVDWTCDVHRNMSEINLGCKERVSSGLNWVFDQVDSAIILEDDCLAHQDFFSYCDALLEYYHDDDRVAVVTGNNFQNGRKRGDASYYFSKYNHCWGWATWRRAWKRYDGDLSFWPAWKRSADWHNKLPDRDEQRYWEKIFDKMYEKKIDTWDFPWTASVLYHGGLTATPNVNLVSNIGFGPDSTHTWFTKSPFSNIQTSSLSTITHPCNVTVDQGADRYVFELNYGGRMKKLLYFFMNLPQWIKRVWSR